MESLYFKCNVCNNDVRMDKEVEDRFADWAYYDCIEWSDFKEDVPEFSEEHWPRSETVPVVGEDRILHVYKPFDESIGNEFRILFEPALVYFNGWEECSNDEDIEKCAIVRCRLMNVLKQNEDEAWVSVNVREVVKTSELYRYFEPCFIDKDVAVFDGICESEYLSTVFENSKWRVIEWNAQGDLGETKWICIDENGIRHLVMQRQWVFGQSRLNIGNIVQKENA